MYICIYIYIYVYIYVQDLVDLKLQLKVSVMVGGWQGMLLSSRHYVILDSVIAYNGEHHVFF